MLYVDTITLKFRNACEREGLIRREKVGRKCTYKESFVTQTTREQFEAVFADATSFEDLMGCWMWAPEDRVPALVVRLLQLKLDGTQEYQVWKLAPPDMYWELSEKAKKVQKTVQTRTRQKRLRV